MNSFINMLHMLAHHALLQLLQGFGSDLSNAISYANHASITRTISMLLFILLAIKASDCNIIFSTWSRWEYEVTTSCKSDSDDKVNLTSPFLSIRYFRVTWIHLNTYAFKINEDEIAQLVANTNQPNKFYCHYTYR